MPDVTYQIRSGDTLTSIARRYNTTVEALARANHIWDPDRIRAGQVLKIQDSPGRAPQPTTSTSSNKLPSPPAASANPFKAKGKNESGKPKFPQLAQQQRGQQQSPGDETAVVLGIVHWSKNPEVRLRAKPSQDAAIVRQLPFNTVLSVLERLEGGWLKVLTRDKRVGYVASDYVWFPPKHRLPEPNAQLYRVPKYDSSTGAGTAIGIAQAHFKNIGWGHDLGFYVAILAAANGREIPRTTKGWQELQFKEGEYIWIPSAQFANSLRGRVSSGSYTYEIAKGTGILQFLDKVAGIGKEFLNGVKYASEVVEQALKRIQQLVQDFAAALEKALPLIWPEMKKQAGEVAASVLPSLVEVAKHMAKVLIGGILAGAGLGFLAGGPAGAMGGAKLGAELAMLYLTLEGLYFIAEWFVKSCGKLFSALGNFLVAVHAAGGDTAKQQAAGAELAKAIGLFVKLLLEGLVIWVTAKGIGAALKALKGTALDNPTVTSWLKERAAKDAKGGTTSKGGANEAQGGTTGTKTDTKGSSGTQGNDAKGGTNTSNGAKTNGPQGGVNSTNGAKTNGPKNEVNNGKPQKKQLSPEEWRLLVRELAKELGIPEAAVESLLQFAEPATLRALKGEMGAEGLKHLSGKSPIIRGSFFEVLKRVEADPVGRETVLEAMRLSREKGSVSDKTLQGALTDYLAFLKHYGERISGDFMSRFLRENGSSGSGEIIRAKAEHHLAEDLMADKTSLGPGRRVEGLPESKVTGEEVPEFRVETPSGSRLAECKAIGEPGKPLSLNGIRNNVGKAHSQLQEQAAKTGESDGLIRLDARNAGKTELTAEQLAKEVSSKLSSTSTPHVTRWVEIFYRNSHGEVVHVVLERGPRFKVHSQEVIK